MIDAVATQRRSAWVLGRRAVCVVCLFLPGRRLEPELAVRARPRDPRAAHAADRRLPAAHRRLARLARALLLGQGARRSLLALVPVAVARGGRRVAGVDPEVVARHRVDVVCRHALPRPACSPSLAALCVFWLALRWGYSRGAALFAATAYGVATPAWCYATLFMGHGVTAGCLMLAFAAAIALGDDAARRQRVARVGRSGSATGWAVLSEFPAAVPARADRRPGALDAARSWPRSRCLRGFASRSSPAARVMAAVLLAYNAAGVRIAVSSRLRERGRLRADAAGLLRHHATRQWRACARSCSAAIAGCCRSRR